MKLVALPALTDNYIWMLHDGVQALVVDPGEAAPVHRALDSEHLRLTGSLVTHTHADHVGGVAELWARLEGPLWGPQTLAAQFPSVQTPPATLTWAGLSVQAWPVPGHTLDHWAYGLSAVPLEHATSPRPVLFCGDTLFSAGCGRLFEGTPAQMLTSLDSLAAWPDDTWVCCTHEYTLANLAFAHAVEPDNPDILAHQQVCQQWRASGQPTLPSDLARERRINPFLRCDTPAVVARAQAQGAASADRLSVFTTLRLWKNRYR